MLHKSLHKIKENYEPEFLTNEKDIVNQGTEENVVSDTVYLKNKMIFLTSVLRKLFTRIITTRLEKKIDTYHQVEHAGFRSKRTKYEN